MDFAARRTIIVGVLPFDVPPAAPRPCIGAFIVNSHFVLQRVEIRAREAFDQVHKTGVRETAPDKPEFFVVAYGIGHQRFSLPVSNGIAKVTGIQLVLRRMFPPRLHCDPAPIAVFPVDDENAIEFGLIDELHAIRNREKPHPTGRLTPRMGVVQSTPRPAVLVKSSRPVLKRNLFQRQISRQARASRPDWTTASNIPNTLTARRP